MSKKIKICGLTREIDIQYANELNLDYIGFVFAESRRKVSMENAIRLKRELDKKIEAVGVFVNEKKDLIIDLCGSGVIDIIQLHGDENDEDILLLKKSTGKKVIKALRVGDGKIDFSKYDSADFYLLDKYAKTAYGGTGEKFEWSTLDTLDINKNYFLAGGINCGNIAEALKTNAFALDLSSGVETDGKKDFDKMKQIVDAIRKSGGDSYGK